MYVFKSNADRILQNCKGEYQVIIRKDGYVLDVDVEETLKYSKEHLLCDCSEDRNLYAQIRGKFPKLTAFLAELGLLIDRPDETGSCAVNDYIDYHFVSYTVIGNILESDKYEIDMFDGGMFLNIVIDNWYVPNEQKTDQYFTVTVYGIYLPWVLDEPFPESVIPGKRISLLERIKKIFGWN